MCHLVKDVFRWVAVPFSVMLWSATSSAATVPYTPDGNTLHLWHLDEVITPCADSAPNGTNLTVLANGASLGNSSFTGFGNCLSTLDGGQSGTAANQKDALLSVVALASGAGDDVPVTLANPTTGAYTDEAVVRNDFNPALTV